MPYNDRSNRYLYRFPDFVLNLHGDHSPVREAVENLFSFLPDTADSSYRMIHMHIQDISDGEISILPEFLTPYLANTEALIEPVMVQGENFSVGFVHAHNGVFTACYYLPRDSRVEFVLVYKRSYADSSQCIAASLCITSVIVPLIREILFDTKQLLFHSAAIACPDGTGILLLADSGGGKTTTSLSLMRLGAKLLGDDLIIMGKEIDALLLYGFPEPLNLSEQTIDFFYELAHLKPTITSVGTKVPFSPQDVYGPFCFQEKVPLHVAYIVQQSPETPYVELLQPQESLGYLLRAHTFAKCQSISRSVIDRVYQILDSVPFYRLYTGSDPIALGKWLLESTNNHARCRFSN